MSQNQDHPLSALDANARYMPQQQQQHPTDKQMKPFSSQTGENRQQQSLHRKLMEQQQNGQQSGHYVSPSDIIMSPMSQKLSSYKQGRLSKLSGSKRVLFPAAKSITGREDAETSPVDTKSETANSARAEERKEDDSKMTEG